MTTPDGKPDNPQRTYLRRRGRTTRGQARALTELSNRYCLDPGAGLLDPASVFGRDVPLGLEIGFGMGHALVEWALQRPGWNLLGIEVYQPGIGAAMLALARHELANVRLLEAPAEQVLEANLGPDSLTEVRIFFPDPWPKKRHHKRRLLQPELVALLTRRLAPDGLLWVATDWADYAAWIVDVLDCEPALTRERAPRVETCGPGATDDEGRPRTRFESRGRRLGHAVWDLRYRRNRASTESR